MTQYKVFIGEDQLAEETTLLHHDHCTDSNSALPQCYGLLQRLHHVVLYNNLSHEYTNKYSQHQQHLEKNQETHWKKTAVSRHQREPVDPWTNSCSSAGCLGLGASVIPTLRFSIRGQRTHLHIYYRSKQTQPVNNAAFWTFHRIIKASNKSSSLNSFAHWSVKRRKEWRR